MKGPAPKPSHLKVVDGRPARRNANLDEPQPEKGARPPSWLSSAALEHWPVIAAELDSMGVLTRVDAAALGLYCEAWARFQSATREIISSGVTVVGAMGGVIKNPACTVAEKAAAEMRALLAEFGATPSSRTRVKVPKAPPKQNPFAALRRRQ